MGCAWNLYTLATPALTGFGSVERSFRSTNISFTIRELIGTCFSAALIDEMVEKCSWQGKRTIGQFVKLDKPDMRKIYEMSR